MPQPLELARILDESALDKILERNLCRHIDLAAPDWEKTAREAFYESVPAASQHLSRDDLWLHLKAELYLLVCTNDEKYKELREAISKQDTDAQIAIISAISLFVASHIGLAAATVIPFCALLLKWLLRIGKNQFCSQLRPNA